MALPQFRYHPDPIATGSVEASQAVCQCCGKARGYIYTGPTYSTVDIEAGICPWCIADGSAHKKFDAEFTDSAGIGGYGDWDEVPQEVIEEVAYRTPGYCGWQQEKWWTHCGDAGEFLGPAGREEVLRFGPELAAELQAETGLDNVEWKEYFAALSKDGSPTAFIFRCRKCGKLGGYSDCD